MRQATTALFVVLMFVFSCTKESVSPESVTGDDYLKAAKAVTKIWKIHESTGTMELVPYTGCPGGHQVLIRGTGHSTHLGAFTVKNNFCADELGNPTGPIYGVLNAANGDSILTMVTDIDFTVDPWVYHYEIQVGSGRFEGAWGYIDMWGDIDYGTMTFDLVGLGEITY